MPKSSQDFRFGPLDCLTISRSSSSSSSSFSCALWSSSFAVARSFSLRNKRLAYSYSIRNSIEIIQFDLTNLILQLIIFLNVFFVGNLYLNCSFMQPHLQVCYLCFVGGIRSSFRFCKITWIILENKCQFHYHNALHFYIYLQMECKMETIWSVGEDLEN